MIRVADSERLRTVTLDRPERRNALTPDALDDIAGAVANPPAPVVYLRGAGSAFCAGADLDSVADVARETLESDSNEETGRGGDETNPAAAFARRGQRTARAIEDSAAVVVAGVDGPARGGGVELALACDLRVATPEATFAEPGVTFGLFGAWGGTHRLARVIGEGNAADLSLTGRSVDAEEALRMGLVSQVRPDPVSVAESVADNDPSALARLKPLLRGEASVADREREEVDAFASLVAEHGERLEHRNG